MSGPRPIAVLAEDEEFSRRVAADMLTAPLYAEHYIFLTRADGPFADRKSIGWAEAATANLGLLHQNMQNRRILDARLAERGLALNSRATADSYVALLAMVQSERNFVREMSCELRAVKPRREPRAELQVPPAVKIVLVD